jgi:hypothetical protein
MLRTSRRKERAARRRTQRGGATIGTTPRARESFFGKVKAMIDTLSEDNLSEIQKAVLKTIKDNNLSKEQQDQLLLDISNAPAKLTADQFTGAEISAEAKKVILNSLKLVPSTDSAAVGPNSNNEQKKEGAGGASAAPEEGEAPSVTAPATAAPWYKVPDDRKADWEAAVAASDISNILLPVIQKGEITPVAYIELLARQNDIFKIAFDIIRSKLKVELGEDITDAYILVKHSEAIKAKSEALMEYINDAEKLIINSKEGGATKLNSIRTQKEDIFELLLFPDRLQNLLVKAVANLCIMLVEDKNYALLKKPELSSILLKQYSSYAESLARSQTAVGMRDGCYLSQDIEKLDATNLINLSMVGHVKELSNESLAAFWKDFISTLNKATDDTTPFSIKTAACEPYINKMSWGEIAANILMQYKRGDFKEEEPYYAPILTLFSGKCNQKPEAITPEYPNESIWKLPLYNTITLEKAFDHIEPMTLEFMLHLAYEITRAAKRAATEAAAPPPSSVTEHPNSQGT